MSSPIEQTAALAIGTVESVSPSEIKVLLEVDAPQAMALNTGIPHGFPRINGYVLIPNETGALVGMIVWLGVERSPFPKRIGMKDFGLVDLPFPLRKLTITPLGTLVRKRGREQDGYILGLERGVSVFPSVGDTVHLPTKEQLKSIVEASDQSDQRIIIGTSPLASNAKVAVDPNKLFGRHLAVLGNTGSGKSCSVAGLIRWSLEAARKERRQMLEQEVEVANEANDFAGRAEAKRKHEGPVNARFIILDPNGEYSPAFADFQNVRKFRVPPVSDGFSELVVPAWMWNSHEWCAFAQASPGVQRPILLQALRDMRAGQALTEPIERRVSRDLRSYRSMLESRIAQGPSGFSGTREASNCGRVLSNIADDAQVHAAEAQGVLASALALLGQTAAQTANGRHWDSDRTRRDRGYNDFSGAEIGAVLNQINVVLSLLPLGSHSVSTSEDAPIPFDVNDLPDHLDKIASDASGGQAAQFVATLSMRIRMMLCDHRLGPVVNPRGSGSTSFEQWLNDYIGADRAANGPLAILDLSLVPSDILHTVIAVIARIVFEASQRYHRTNGKELPTVLVLEEAHTFVRRGGNQEDGIPTPAQMCRQTFERIAREGRKFGLGLVLSSQRPSELSQTVLAQCNTFLLHRIVNDQDQELVGKLVPDNLGGLLRELPSLPSKQAILLGWAVAIPALVEITELPDAQRPRSSDPKFWEVWDGEEERPINWKDIVGEWVGNATAQNESCVAEENAEPAESTAPQDSDEDDIPF